MIAALAILAMLSLFVLGVVHQARARAAERRFARLADLALASAIMGHRPTPAAPSRETDRAAPSREREPGDIIAPPIHPGRG
jgi:type II secretory pathway pseudopilin PulG